MFSFLLYLLFHLQDNYAIMSFERGISAQNGGHFTWGNSSGIIFDSILSRKKLVVFGLKSISTVNSVQVEMSGGKREAVHNC